MLLSLIILLTRLFLLLNFLDFKLAPIGLIHLTVGLYRDPSPDSFLLIESNLLLLSFSQHTTKKDFVNFFSEVFLFFYT